MSNSKNASVMRFVVAGLMLSVLLGFVGWTGYCEYKKWSYKTRPFKPLPPAPKAIEQQHFSIETLNLLRAKNFKQLEENALRFRASDERLVGGKHKIHYFYEELGSYQETTKSAYDLPFALKEQFLQEWLKTYPKSLAARLALANLYYNAAWGARGVGFAKEVSEENFKLFHERLQKSGEFLKNVDANADSYVYERLLALCELTQQDKTPCDALYVAASKRFPSYLGYYADRANFLQEKWRLNKSDLPNFLNELLTEKPESQGLIKYAEAATSLMCTSNRENLQKAKLEWQKVKEAYLMREKIYGLTNHQRNTLIAYAGMFGDKEIARSQLAKIGDAWDECVWQEQQYFENVVNWVNN